MINKIIAFSIKNKFVVGLLVLTLIGGGIYAMTTVNLGAVPDITNNQVQVMTVAPNLGTEDIEQFVTYPIELAMGNLPEVNEIRSISRFGLSVVTIVFEESMGTYKPRQLVSEKLNEIKAEIPEKFGTPFMGPITTGLGGIYQYSINIKPGYDSIYDLSKLRTIQDWIVARQLTMVNGVIGVNTLGGKVKQYEIAISPEKLNAFNVGISQVYEALSNNNLNTGGAYIVKNNMANFIRGEGLVKSLDDIRQIVVTTQNGIPLTIGDIAEKVHYGSQIRYGAFTHDGKEAVGGVVMMLKDANPNITIKRVEKRMKEIEKSLPEGLEIKPFLERSDLINRTIGTVSKNLIEGALIVIFVLVLLLGSLRGGLITASIIPLSLLFAFILMRITGVWANLMSLGAIDFGIIVDGAVIIVEGSVYLIQKSIKNPKVKFTQKMMDNITYEASSTMMNSAFFGQLIILIVFTPILFLEGVEGKMFRPMAYTFGFAVLGAIILCITYVPMMASLVMRPIKNPNNWFAKFERFIEHVSLKIVSGLHRAYLPLIKGALKIRAFIIVLALLLFGSAYYTFSNMGGEFIPQLDEGDIAMHALLRPGSSLEEMIDVTKKVEHILLSNFPEVKTVAAQIGVPDIPTDPMPMDVSDMIVVLEKNRDKWVSADSKQELIHKIEDKLNRELVGVNYEFTQPIEMRFNELLSGVTQDVAIKLFGDDLDVLNVKAQKIAQLISTIPGVADISPERISGLPQITVDYNRAKVAQYGLNIKKLNAYVTTAFAGGKAGVVFEGGRRFDLVVRFSKAYRSSIDDLRHMYIDLDDGTQIPISEVATISYQPGPMQISRENTFRRTYVGVNIRGRDVESVVNDIRHKLDKELDLPPGYQITYGGEFENLQRATNRLQVVVPIALLLIFILLYFALKSFSQALMIYAAIPLAAIGGIFFLALRGIPFSISAGVGFIVLFGVAVLNGLVLISRFNSLKEEGYSLKERIIIGTDERLRPILLTATAAIMGFIPMAFSSSAGAEVQRPLATVVIGGLITATFLTLIVLPVLYSYIEERQTHQKMSLSKTTIISLLVLCSSFLSQNSVQAQTLHDNHNAQLQANLPSLSLEEAVNRATANYPLIKAAKLNIKKEQVLRKTAWDFGFTNIITGKDEVYQGQADSYTKVGLKQGEINIFGIVPKLKLQKAKIALAQEGLQLSTLEIRQKVSQAWGQVYTMRKTYEVFSQLDSMFRKIDKASQLKLEVEAISKLEYLATSNQANQVLIQKKQAYHEYLKALEKLNLWFVTDTVFTVPQVSAASIDPPFNYQQDSLNNHPLMIYAAQQVAVAKAHKREIKSQFLPKLSGEYRWQEVGGQSGYYSYQIGISIPLMFAPQLGRSQSAKIEQKIAEAQYQDRQLKVKTAFQTAQATYLKWKDSWQYYRDKALPLAVEQQTGALTAYREGAIDYVSFLQNIKSVIDTEVNAWTVFGKYLNSRYALEYYLNTEKITESTL